MLKRANADRMREDRRLDIPNQREDGKIAHKIYIPNQREEDKIAHKIYIPNQREES